MNNIGGFKVLCGERSGLGNVLLLEPDLTNLTVPTDASWIAHVDFVGRDVTSNDTFCERQAVCVKNISGTSSVIKMSTISTFSEGTLANAAVFVEGNAMTTSDLDIIATSGTTNMTKWSATVMCTQVIE